MHQDKQQIPATFKQAAGRSEATDSNRLSNQFLYKQASP